MIFFVYRGMHSKDVQIHSGKNVCETEQVFDARTCRHIADLTVNLIDVNVLLPLADATYFR